MESCFSYVYKIEMGSIRQIIIFFTALVSLSAGAQNPMIILKGKVTEEGTGKSISHAVIKLSGSLYGAETNPSGEFTLLLPKKQVYDVVIAHLTYQAVTKAIKRNGHDTLTVSIKLRIRSNQLDTLSVIAVHKPETLVGKPDYSVFDFDFYEDKLLLLTAKGSLQHAELQLSDYNGRIYSAWKLPAKAGSASHFFHDFEGYTDLVCRDSVYRVDVVNTEMMVMPFAGPDFNSYVLPIADTAAGNYYYKNQWNAYPAFNYYYLGFKDTVANLLNTVCDPDLMKLYNLEYYYLPSGKQLEARRIADRYKTDVHIIAALLSGFTQSMYYTPLYAPLFILRDTICIFNHHNDHLYHYNRQNILIDSVKILYHHPKNWKEWKKQLYVDEPSNKVYAFFSRDGHHYLKHIDHRTGKEQHTYKLKHHSAEKIKLKDGYVYYVYRPFGSTQERFLYRERIE